MNLLIKKTQQAVVSRLNPAAKILFGLLAAGAILCTGIVFGFRSGGRGTEC